MLELNESSTTAVDRCNEVPRDFVTADGWGWTYVASREELLSAGVCMPAHFPEGKKRTAWNYKAGPDRHWELTKLKGGLWKLRIVRTLDERAKFEAQQRAREKSCHCSESTEARWKESQAYLLNAFLDGLVGAGITRDFQLAEKDQDAIQALGRRMLMVLNAASPERIETTRDDEIAEPQPVLRAPLRLACSSNKH